MRRLVILLAIGLLGFGFSSLAQASWVDDNFNDNSMNPNLWTTKVVEDDGGGSEGQLHFYEQNERLEWETDLSWTDSTDNSRGYISTWNFILDHDFKAKVDFYYNHTIDPPDNYSDEGGVFFGVSNPLAPILSTYYAISAKNHGTAGQVYQTSAYGFTETRWARTSLSGYLAAEYIVSEDKLYFSASEGGPVAFAGLKASGINELNVFLMGWSGGAKLNGYDAYFDNFTVTEGHIIPEPGTMILLGSLATGLFGFAGIRRKK